MNFGTFSDHSEQRMRSHSKADLSNGNSKADLSNGTSHGILNSLTVSRKLIFDQKKVTKYKLFVRSFAMRSSRSSVRVQCIVCQQVQFGSHKTKFYIFVKNLFGIWIWIFKSSSPRRLLNPSSSSLFQSFFEILKVKQH